MRRGATFFARSAFALLAAATLVGCASTAPAATPVAGAPTASSTSPSSAPPAAVPTGARDCADIAPQLTVPDSMTLEERFMPLHSVATASVGGFSCMWLDDSPAGTVSGLGLVVVPESLAEGVPMVEGFCGTTEGGLPGCASRKRVSEYVVATTVWGDPSADSTSALLDAVTAAVTPELIKTESVGPVMTDLGPLPCDRGFDDQTLPADIGQLQGPQGTDGGPGWDALHSAVFDEAQLRTLCLYTTSEGYTVNVSTLGRGAFLLEDPVYIDGSELIELSDGRVARLVESDWQSPADIPASPVAQTAFDLDGHLVMVQVLDKRGYLASIRGDEPPPAGDIRAAAIAISAAVGNGLVSQR